MNNKLPVVFAITLNWNRPEYTCECVDSLLSQKQVLVKPIIVDNGSIDSSVKIFYERYGSKVKIIQLPQNYGFATGINYGIRYALDEKAEYILIINNDAILDTESLKKMITVLKDGFSVVAPVIYEFPNIKRVWSTGGYINNLIFEPLDAHHRSEDLSRFQVVQRTFLSGCIMLFTRSLLLEIGLFDERFFMYYEDLDLCFRIVSKGHQLAICTSAKGYHRISASSGGKENPFEKYHMARSSGIYFRKHVRGMRWLPVLIFRFASWGKTTFGLILRGKLKELRSFFRGLFDGWLKNFV